jgi:hypothetical protein
MKSIIMLLLTSCFVLSALAQDIIIRTDKTELKVKVIELTDDKIKYKKWEMQDGPIYNISRADVFMIIYENGEREMMTAPTPVASQSPVTEKPIRSTASQIEPEPTASSKVSYMPSRIYASLSAPFTMGIDQEIRLIKNVLNIGSTYEIINAESFSSDTYALYLSAYVPVNRLAKNYRNQDKGLFLFGQAGYYYTSTTLDVGYENISVSAGEFGWRLGMDFLISKGFGLTVVTHKFSSVRAGIVLNFF